jgi:hypothetical protein
VFDSNAIKIISGGQTGADRAALDFSIKHGFEHGGWCPHGRKAEDGVISAHYELRETPSRRYAQRTEWNVRDSDATVAFTIRPEIKGGTSLTMTFARRLDKPALHLSRDALAESGGDAIDAAAFQLLPFLREHDVRSLNVAGPRASQEPDVAEFVHSVLQRVLC